MSAYRPEFWPQGDNGIVGILDMCLDLHMQFTGSSDCLSDDTKNLYIKCLQHSLTNWRWLPNPLEFDKHAYRLVVTTLREWESIPEGFSLPNRKVYIVDFEIGDAGPNGERQTTGFTFEYPPTRDDLIKAVQTAVEAKDEPATEEIDFKAIQARHKKHEDIKKEYGAALLDFFAYCDKYKEKIYSEGIVIGNSPNR